MQEESTGPSGTPEAAANCAPRLTFPCDYPIKVMVRTGPDVRPRIDAIVAAHAAVLPDQPARERASAQGNFLAITYLIVATGESQLAALFEALRRCPEVLLVL